MAKGLDYLAGARQDFDDSFDWYAERSEGAAIGFAAAVDEALEKIAAEPGIFLGAPANCRYCTVKRYPFRVVFREETERIVIVAIAHAKRRPGYWRHRT